jgi:hypothetical protein
VSDAGVISLGGVLLPEDSYLDWSQTRTVVRSQSVLEFADLSIDIQIGPTSNTKRVVSLSCSGWAPPGIDALAADGTHTLQWEEPQAGGAWATQSMSCKIIEPVRYVDNPRAPGGGTVAWTITLREV